MTTSVPTPGEQRLNPQPILDMNYAFARTAMMVAAVRLHLFTHLAQGAQTITALATATETAAGPLARLLKGLEGLGLLAKDDDIYRLTPLADQFLVEGKPLYLGGDTMGMVDYLPAWFGLDHTLRTTQAYRDLGDVATAEAFFAPRVRDLFPLVNPIASRYATELPLHLPEGTALQVLDVGAGSAPWSAAFAQRYVSAQVTALDLSAVVIEGKRQIDELGLHDRYTWISADMNTVELLPLAYHLIIVGHVFRFIGDEQVQTLISKLKKSLRPGGTLLVADIFLSDDQQGPPAAINLDISMLVNTAQGRIRTCDEMVVWLRDSGLQEARRLHMAGPFPLVVARKEEEA